MAFQRVSVTAKKPNTVSNAVSPNVSGSKSAADTFRMRSQSIDDVGQPMQTQSTNMRSTKQELSMNVNTISRNVLLAGVGIVLVLGLGTGFAGAYVMNSQGGTAVVSTENQKTAAEVEDAVRVGAVFGVPDESTFRDDTEGVLIKGGLDGEGSHSLLRAGGISQNVYLTSSVVDLDQFVGHRVRIWGETFKGQKAGWLMDVGRVEVKELTADKPEWYQEDDE